MTSMTVVCIMNKWKKEYARRLFRLFAVESEGCAVSGMTLGEAVMRGNSACAGHLSDSAGAGRVLMRSVLMRCTGRRMDARAWLWRMRRDRPPFLRAT